MNKLVQRRVSGSYGEIDVELDERMGRSLDQEGSTRLSRSSSISRNHTLHQCARSGNADGLRRLLRDPEVVSRVNDLDEHGISALHYAARGNFFECVTTLLKQGNADTMVQDEEEATPLHYVARKLKTNKSDDTVKIIELLSRTADVNARDQYWSTPLHVAAMRGNVTAANALLSVGGVLVNAKDHLGCTPLHEASTYNHAIIVSLLIDHGARLLLVDNEKCSALHLASGEGVTDIVRILLERCDDNAREQFVACKDKDDCCALHYAIESHSYASVKLLIDHGSDVNARCRLSTHGSTPLHLAAVAGDCDIAKLLLEKGARMESRDLKDTTPLHRAAEYDCVELTKILLKHVSVPIEVRDQFGYTPLQTAVIYGSTEIVKLLLAENACVDTVDDDERSSLYQTVLYEHVDILKILLREIKNTDNSYLVNSTDMDGNAPLHVAASNGNVDMIKMLLRRGADISIKNENEETPFISAAIKGQNKVVSMMLKKTEKVINDEDEYSNTALHHASSNGHMEVVTMLVEWGADKEARNTRSQCPLDLAAANGHVAVVKFLLDEDVSPNPLDKENVTPLHLASRNGHDNVVEVLIQHGADVAAVDVDGNNCLDIAIDFHQKRVVATILKSKSWHIALAQETSYPSGKPRNSPLRKLIRKMPEMAPMAFSKCISTGSDGDSVTDEAYHMEFNYDYIDDTFTEYKKLQKHYAPPLLQDKALPAADSVEYTRDTIWLKENHPLMIAMRTENDILVSHPLVLANIRHKWAVARGFYLLFNLFYMLYLALLTAYLLSSPKPYDTGDEGEEGITRRTTLDAENSSCTDGWVQSDFEIRSKYLIWVLAGFGLLGELLQAFFQRWVYLNPVNLLDWFSYVSSIILVVDIADCGMRTDWQWQMGAFTLLVTWFSLILYLRRLPGLGIYVVMIVEIFNTFAKFFVAFLLFIIAFALTFYLLMANQDSFSTPAYSIVRTTVMMIGEIDFEETFHSDQQGEEIVYEGVAYTVFLIFLFLVAIIIMNLLVGLAVDDVNGLRQRARVVKLQMQVDFALDVELALPDSWKKALRSTVRRGRIYPNIDWGSLWRLVEKLQDVVEGTLLSQEGVVAGVKEMESAGELPELLELEERIAGKIKRNRMEMQTLGAKLDRIERILEAMAPQQAGRITPVRKFNYESPSEDD